MSGRFLFLVALVWVIVCSLAIHFLGWSAEQAVMIVGLAWPGWTWFALSLLHSLLLLIPCRLLARRQQNPRYRPAYQTWVAAAAFVLLLSPVRLVKGTASQMAALLQILFTLLYLTLLLLLIRRRPPPAPNPQLSTFNLQPSTFLISALLTYPWLAWGALGSWLDTALNLVAALLFGLAAGLTLDTFWLQPLRQAADDQPGRHLALGGWVAGATLLIMAAGFGFNGAQLLLMFTLSSLGWALTALARPPVRRGWLPLAWLLGLATAGPLLLVDPDELLLILGLGEISQWAFQAAGATMLVGWSAGLILYALRRRSLPPPSKGAGLRVSTAVAWLLAGVLYLRAGQPGFYGERLFVILKEQADLSAAATISNVDGRRQVVYQTLVKQAETNQAALRTDLERLGLDYTPYYLVNAIEVEGGLAMRLWLSRRPEVDRVLDSPRLRPLPEPIPSGRGQEAAPTEPPWNLTLIGADRVWREFGVTGAGVVIGQSDSGVQGDHPELAASYRGQGGRHDYNWYDPWHHTTAPSDLGGHGTHTLGSIVGQMTGVAPGAEWIGCVNLARNLGNPALYLDCLQFMLAPFPLNGDPFHDGDPSLAADVLNNSWGCPEIEGCDPGALLAAVQALRAAGIFVVASAGNEGTAGCSTINDPIALYDEVFSVGAINQEGELAFFSSLGPVEVDGSGRTKPDVVAPGQDILSAFPQSTYASLEGTSMAGPHVAGVVALIWSANPTLIGDIERTEAILTATARPYTGRLPGCVPTNTSPNNAAGYGLVDAYEAVQMALEE
ncbi:MAG: S8 family serine peptidase [Chloroflexota bacterium]